MDSRSFPVSSAIFATLYFLLSRNTQLAAHKIHREHHHFVTSVTVRKDLSFSSFHPRLNPTSTHDIKLLGSATISDDNGIIQIPDPSWAANRSCQAGRAVYNCPIRMFEPVTKSLASFRTTFSFQFTATMSTSNATDDSSSSRDRGGSGLAFVLVPDEFTVGRAGPWLGLLNDACGQYKIFAVEFDNSHDTEFGDPNDDHVGINLGTIVSMKTADLSGTTVSLHNDSVQRAWINYDGHRKWIDVYLGADNDHLPNQTVLSSPLDLSGYINEFMFVGFSASTAKSTQIHSVLSWNFSSTIEAFLQVPSERTCKRNLIHQVSKYSKVRYSRAPSGFLVFVAVVALCTLALVVLYSNSNPQKRSPSYSFPDIRRRPTPPSKPRSFTIHEIYRATLKFSKSEMLSSDPKGVLYRGTLPNGRHIAVKRFSQHLESQTIAPSIQARIMKRIHGLNQFCHPNLAPIKGWCYKSKEIIVVYDYFQNGSLDKWLFGLGVLPWTRRFNLIKDIAKALSFLHSKDTIHGNLRTSSVFLDISYRAVLADYALVTAIANSNRGENVLIGKRKDVFGFGKMVLEIVAGKRSGDMGEKEATGILGFAWNMHERGEKNKVVDERMGLGGAMEQALRALDVGLVCTLNEENCRVSMEDVVQLLKTKAIPKLPQKKPAQLS
ncbi:L-type lectin-domain containing receptor kinase VIII.2-like [Rhodamnia argentea]|uniref:L-type lectin-domain containing receptor kinase VIII.2-like n=1 Tax=Rhodamnia argentea TaxID=178133 RepID=A0A8B8PTG8_9MYRT|nr:L-type lectin-domain containing receptor kinase VIII.2-like [Rhodamnia argentea]